MKLKIDSMIRWTCRCVGGGLGKISSCVLCWHITVAALADPYIYIYGHIYDVHAWPIEFLNTKNSLNICSNSQRQQQQQKSLNRWCMYTRHTWSSLWWPVLLLPFVLDLVARRACNTDARVLSIHPSIYRFYFSVRFLFLTTNKLAVGNASSSQIQSIFKDAWVICL